MIQDAFFVGLGVRPFHDGDFLFRQTVQVVNKLVNLSVGRVNLALVIQQPSTNRPARSRTA